jgi:5'-nucleotidase
MRVLVTNDDGVDSRGIGVLAHVAQGLGFEVVVAAPAWNSSGASASLTGVASDGRLHFEARCWTFLPGVPVFAVHATPAMIARVAIRGGFGPAPDAVLSGVNDGPNTGHAVLHSGTVGAVLTAATHGCRGIAFSLGVGRERDHGAAVAVARTLLPWALDTPEMATLNVNVPAGPASLLRGVRHARLAQFGAVQTTVTELDEGHVQLEYTEIVPGGEPDEPDSDARLLAAGWATVTALQPVCEAPGARADLPALDARFVADSLA